MRHAAYRFRRYLEDLATSITASAAVPVWLRSRVLVLLGLRVTGAVISPGCVFEGRQVTIGRGTFIGHRCHFDANGATVTIGARCGIGAGSRFIVNNHEIGGPDERGGPRYQQPVTVSDGVWIASGVTVLPGVTIAAGCVIAAGAVVTRDTKPDGLYAGVPARRLRDL